jgi:hypothetical protein
MASQAPSTVAPNPLRDAMTSIVGADPLSQSTGTSLINYGDTGGARLPASDIIAITGDPGTGATTAETWAHEIALENQRRDLAQFAWQQQQANLQNAISQAAERRAADMYGAQVASLNYANQLAQQQYALNQAAENREAQKFQYSVLEPREQYQKALAAQQDYDRFRGGFGVPISQSSMEQYNAYKAAGSPTTGYLSTYHDPSYRPRGNTTPSW